MVDFKTDLLRLLLMLLQLPIFLQWLVVKVFKEKLRQQGRGEAVKTKSTAW